MFNKKIMKKIRGTLILSVLGVSFISCGGNDNKQGVHKITIAHGTSESFHMHKALLEFEKKLEETGKFDVTIYPSSQFGNDTEMIESVKTGDITIAVPPSPFLTDERKEIALIELPYVFPSKEVAIKTLDGEWGKKQLDALKNSGLHGLGYLESGMRHLTNSKKPVRTPKDLRGLKLRTMQVPAHVDFWNSLDCSAEGAPFPELYTNLSTKVFDGQENPIAHIYSQKFYEVQKYITLTEHAYTVYIPVMQEEFWQSLSNEEQNIINTALESAHKYQFDLIQKEEEKQLKEIAANKTYPCEIIELTKEEKQMFIDAAQPTLEKYKLEVGEESFNEFMDAIKKASN